MLALVKKPRIEISLQGEHVDELIEWIRKKFEVRILTFDNSESIAIEETDFWNEMQSNKIGNLLSGARLKANLSQAQLAEKLGIRQNMISDYERGKRRLSSSMAQRIAKTLRIKIDRITWARTKRSKTDIDMAKLYQYLHEDVAIFEDFAKAMITFIEKEENNSQDE